MGGDESVCVFFLNIYLLIFISVNKFTPKVNLELAIQPFHKCMCLDCGRKLEYLERYSFPHTETQREYANSTKNLIP